jgi:predicted phage tail protein
MAVTHNTNDSVSMKDYTDNQTKWLLRIVHSEGKLREAEAKLREAVIAGESKLREAVIAGEGKLWQLAVADMKEAVKVFNLSMDAWKSQSNEWRLQSKDQIATNPTRTEMLALNAGTEQRVNEVNKRLDEKFDQIMLTMKPISDYVQAAQGGSKVWYIIIAAVAAIVGGFITHVLLK